MYSESNPKAIVVDFFARYEVKELSMAMMTGIVDTERVCNVTLEYEDSAQVQFKLQGKQADIGACISRLASDGSIGTVSTGAEADYTKILRDFFTNIDGRLSRIQHEQSVQGITFLGNTFRLDNKSVFTVIADDDGRLTIELHRGDKRQSAMLLASSLLDGLYDGTIRPLTS